MKNDNQVTGSIDTSFSGNVAALKEKLFESGVIRNFKEGDMILREDSYIRSIPIVLSGSIKVLKTDDEGREILLYYIQEGESCIMSFLGGMHHETSKIKAITEEESEILFVPVEKVISLIKEFPEWLDYIFRLYHKRFEELLEVVNAIAFTKVDERLLQLLQKKASLTGSNIITITHEQLAAELSSARAVVSRLLKQMEEKRLVRLGRNKIELV
jgi:CRP/FNR family transcriptional regulator